MARRARLLLVTLIVCLSVPFLGTSAWATVDGNRQTTCVAMTSSGSITPAGLPSGPFDRDVALYWTVSSGSCDGPQTSLSIFEPMYYLGDGSSSTDNGYSYGVASWVPGDYLTLAVYDYGSCTPSLCPDAPVPYAVPAGWQGFATTSVPTLTSYAPVASSVPPIVAAAGGGGAGLTAGGAPAPATTSDVALAATHEATSYGPLVLAAIAVLAVLAWTLKGAFVAWRTASKATSKVGG